MPEVPATVGGRVARRRDELLGQIADEHGWQIVAGVVMPDHVHLFVRVGPADASVGYVSETTVHRYIEGQWDAVPVS